jgi:hypothetical protein
MRLSSRNLSVGLIQFSIDQASAISRDADNLSNYYVIRNLVTLVQCVVGERGVRVGYPGPLKRLGALRESPIEIVCCSLYDSPNGHRN